jgi:tetratricopeptide (TPR) repeat protein
MAAVTADSLWIQDIWEKRQIPRHALAGVEARWGGQELVLTVRGDPLPEQLMLRFASAEQGVRWHGVLKEWPQSAEEVEPPAAPGPPQGVALVRQAPDVPHTVLGLVEFTASDRWRAERGLQLRAGIRGADAVIHFESRTIREARGNVRLANGLAVRVDGEPARQRLRLCWFGEEARATANRLLVLLALEAACLFLAASLGNVAPLAVPTGETPSQTVATNGLWLGLLFACPFALVGLLWLLRWPPLLPAAGLAALAVTTGRGLTVWASHLLAALAVGASLTASKLWILADPIDWAFIIAGVVLGTRAWRLAGASRHMLPPEAGAPTAARRAWARGLVGATGVFALAFLGVVGYSRYEGSSYLLRPGMDPRREQEALLALNEGAAQANRGDLDAAERSLQRALGLWEALAGRPSAPTPYRANLATTLYNLGWIRDRQSRDAEAEKFYARAVEIADALGDDPQTDDQFRQTMADGRQALAELRAGASAKSLEDKEKAAQQKYEEAVVRADKGDVAAERLYAEALALWEEVLAKATNEPYRTSAVTRLAAVYLMLGELQVRSGKRPEAQASLRKAIDYGEKAVAREPDRALTRHNLDVARKTLDGLLDRGLLNEIQALTRADREGDAVALYAKAIGEQEEELRSGKDQATATRRLAFRLDRLAWLLAHCLDGRVRDTKAAVKHARRATQLQPDVGDHWYTLATVQYRNGDWQDSLASLEKLRAREGAYDGSGLLLLAMNRHRLKQRDAAREALRQAVEWIKERERQAEGNAALRFQFELMRPGLEALRQEAEDLLEGRDPGGRRLGRLTAPAATGGGRAA